MVLRYQQPGLTLSRNGNAPEDLVCSLQRDLRALGYKSAGINGFFDAATERAIRALQIDLLKPAPPGLPASGMSRYNSTDATGVRVTAVTGMLDQALARCMAAMLADPTFSRVPDSGDPRGDNARVLAAIRAHPGATAPSPFVVAIVRQESGGRHYAVPHPGEEDAFVTVGLDRNNAARPDEITSRGYGVGQYTLTHHPPADAEVRDFILDPVSNVESVYSLLRRKLDRFVAGPDDKADDRAVEHPLLPIRLCRYAPSDVRYMMDCSTCARAVRTVQIVPGMPVYQGARTLYEPDQYYPSANYHGVPDRAEFLCDWPYAVRRYNGSGLDSFHYQARVLRNLLTSSPGEV